MSTFFTTLRLKLYDCWLSCLEAALPADRPSPLFGLLNAIFNGILLVWGCALIFSQDCSVSSFRWVILGIVHAGINMFFAAAVMAVTRYKIIRGIPIMTSTFYIFALEPVILIYIAYLIWEITWIVMAMQSAIYTTKDSCGHHIYVQVGLLVAYLLTGAVVFGCTFMSTWGAMPEWRERANTCWNFNNRMARMANPSTSSRSAARVREGVVEGRKRTMSSTPESFMDGGRRVYLYNSHSSVNNNNINNNNHQNINSNSIFHTVSNHTISSGDMDNSSLHNHSIHSNVHVNNNTYNRANLDLLMEKDREQLCQELHVSHYRKISENRNCEFDKYLQSYHYNDNYRQFDDEPQLQQRQYNWTLQSTLDNFDKEKADNNSRYSNTYNDGRKDKFNSIANNNNNNMCNYHYDKQEQDPKQQEQIEQEKIIHLNEEYNGQSNAKNVSESEHNQTKMKESDSIVNGIEGDVKDECKEGKVETSTECQVVQNNSNGGSNNFKTDINTKETVEKSSLSTSPQQQEQQEQELQQSLPQNKKYTDPNANVEERSAEIVQVHQ